MMDKVKKKPLSDITNSFNLIPISSLRELVASTSKSSGSFSNPRNLILKEDVSSTKHNLCSVASSTSIGSTNAGNSRNTRAVSSSTVRNVPGSKIAAFNTRNLIDIAGKGRGIDLASVGPHSSEMREDKAIAASFGTLSVAKMKAKQVGILRDHCSNGRNNGKDKGKLNPSSGLEDALVSSERSEKGMSADYSSCSTNMSSSSFSGKMKGINIGVLKPTSLSILETTNTRKESPSSSFISQEIEDSGKHLFPSSSSHDNLMESISSQPSNKVETKKLDPASAAMIIETKKLDSTSAALTANVRSARKKTDKRMKTHISASLSCPPATKARNKVNDLIEPGYKPSISRTAPAPCSKAKKKRCCSEIDQDFIQKQKAYFKEVDEFQLEEEEEACSD